MRCYRLTGREYFAMVLFLLLFLACGIDSVKAKPTPICTRANLAEFTFRVSELYWQPTNTDEAIRDMTYADLGMLKRAARDGEAALQAATANREGLYDWLDTMAKDEPTHRYTGKLIDCLNALEIKRALLRGKQGAIPEWRAQSTLRNVSADADDERWLRKLIERNLDEMAEIN